MTDQHHPLTDEICERVSRRCVSTTTSIERDNMRTAADWQLEEVTKWLNETIFERGSCLEAVNIPEELAEAMRPTNTQEDS